MAAQWEEADRSATVTTKRAMISSTFRFLKEGSMFRHWKYVSVALLAFLVGIAVVGAWVSAHGGDPNAIHSCVNERTGEVRITSPTSRPDDPNFGCSVGWKPVDWAIQGPQGEQGPPGPPSTGGGGLLVSGCGSDSGGVRYFVPSGPSFLNQGGNINNQFSLPTGGKFLSLAVNPGANAFEGGATLVTLLVNGADTPLQVSIPAGSTAVKTVAAEVPLVAGDLVTLRVDTTAATGGGYLNPCFATYEYRLD